MTGIEIKICGLTRCDDAAYALEAGADYVGFVLYAGSPRCIGALKLARVLDRIHGRRKAVGVFVNESRANVEKIASDCDLFAVQLNGDEKAADFEGMCVPVWRSVRFRDKTCSPPPGKWKATRYVVDSALPGLYGGTGQPTDWKRAAIFAGKHLTMLAGGLTPANVADAVRAVRPAGVDVSSGVERSPRRKDRRKIAAFVWNVREAIGKKCCCC